MSEVEAGGHQFESFLADRAIGLTFQDLSTSAVRLAKSAISDTFGVGLAGIVDGAAKAAATILPSEDSREGATVWTTGCRAPVSEAAFANAVSCRSLDWDDYSHPMHGHASAVLLPTCLALAKHFHLGGRAMIAAFVSGYEITGLVGSILDSEHYEIGWHPTNTVGVLGAAAAASSMLGLSREVCGHALGIAASCASGLRVNQGSMTNAFDSGRAARDGVMAALLASKGVKASPSWFLGTHGYVSMFNSSGELRRRLARLESRSEQTYVIEQDWGLVQKKYPCCGSSHAAIEATIELVQKHGIEPESIDCIEIHLDPLLLSTLVYPEPSGPYEARYSMQYIIANAVADGAVTDRQFEPESLFRRNVRNLMPKIGMIGDLKNVPEKRFRTNVIIHAAGLQFAQTVDFPKGHPSRPLSSREHADKFASAARLVPSACSGDFYTDLLQLDRVGDVAGLSHYFRILP